MIFTIYFPFYYRPSVPLRDRGNVDHIYCDLSTTVAATGHEGRKNRHPPRGGVGLILSRWIFSKALLDFFYTAFRPLPVEGAGPQGTMQLPVSPLSSSWRVGRGAGPHHAGRWG